MRIDGRKLALKEEGKVAQDNSRLAGEVRGLKAQVRTIPSSSLCLPSTVCLSQLTLLLLQVASLRSKVDAGEVEREDREVKAKLAKAAGAEKAARSEAAKAKKEMEAQKELVGKCTALEETCKTLTLQVRKSAVFCLFACLNCLPASTVCPVVSTTVCLSQLTCKTLT